MSNPGSETNYVNDYATIPVPLDQRRSSFSLAMVLVGSIICLSSIYVGASFVGQLSLSEVVTACLVGNAVLSVLGGLLSYIGTKTGVGIAMLMRQSFGVLGNYIIAVLTAIVELVWLSVRLFWLHDPRHVSQCRIYHRACGRRYLGRPADDDNGFHRLQRS